MSKSVSMVGERFNQLVVVSEYSNGHRVIRHCVCDCGNEIDTTLDKLKSGHTKSCGCLKSKTGDMFRTHGMSRTRLWRIFSKMIRRCYVPEEPAYRYYGAKGIKICDEWMQDRSLFFEWAKSNGYSDELTIDRIDVNGNYEPDNCRWSTAREQTRNKTNNRRYTFSGRTQVLSDWAKEYEMNVATLRNRLEKGWNIEKALTTPISTSRRNKNAIRISKGVS